ncbi:hypothetical protein BDP27DRAFT_232260 [Rhodocollybia butyracea]|uniref:Uncharacterized protein n=1 Tax=Rhodocollybia butyracea TaxID=206335 RepID=A0A9P5PI42_9AGAR|nr:hypothetical protein BDP27DRAFT_232260 [Rhodocollybia butyracea]
MHNPPALSLAAFVWNVRCKMSVTRCASVQDDLGHTMTSYSVWKTAFWWNNLSARPIHRTLQGPPPHDDSNPSSSSNKDNNGQYQCRRLPRRDVYMSGLSSGRCTGRTVVSRLGNIFSSLSLVGAFLLVRFRCTFRSTSTFPYLVSRFLVLRFLRWT